MLERGKVEYSIVSRGELVLTYKDNTISISGELVLNPPIFYADLVSLEKSVCFSKEEKQFIMGFIVEDSFQRIGTKVVFD